MAFGENLKAARIAAGYTQKQMADMLCVHRTTYTKYETQGVEPTLGVLRKITSLLRVSADSLLQEEALPKPEGELSARQEHSGRRICPICHRLFPTRHP